MTGSRARLLLAVLLSVSFGAHAEWSYFGALPAGAGDAYVDLLSRSQVGDRSRIRFLANYAAPHVERDGTSIRSSTSTQEFECAARRTHLLERQVHDASFAQGATRATQLHDQPWQAIAPGSRGESLMALACSPLSLVVAPTRDWTAQPLVAGSVDLRYDPAHTQRQGQMLSLRWLMEQAPEGLQPPEDHKAASTEVEMGIDCDKQRILSTTGLGRSASNGRGSAATISARTQEDALDQALPAPLATLVRKLCSAR